MSVFAYLSPRHEPLKMPDADKTPNQCDIKWQGPILSGKQATVGPAYSRRTRLQRVPGVCTFFRSLRRR
jgi:hypothetical protein